METTLLVLHVVAAVFLVGPMAVLPMSGLRALRGGDRAQVASLARSTNFVSLLSILVVVFGFAVMGNADEKYHLSITTSWIWPSLLMYVVALGLNLLVVVPAMRAAADGSGQGSVTDAEYGKVAASSGVSSLLLVAIVVLMVWRP